MLMMSAELRSHPCDLIKPNLGQSILAAAEHLNIIITLLQPSPLSSPFLHRARPSVPGQNSCSSAGFVTVRPALDMDLYMQQFGSEFHHDRSE